MRLISWLLLCAGALALLVPGLLLLSSWASLDCQRGHTTETASLPRLSPEISEGRVQIPARGLVFRARVAGLHGGRPALVLLHGFPETSAMWEPLIGAADAAGFRVVAFDQRGYSPGARPGSTAAYRLPELTADLLGVADAVGFERFHLVGHDWGAVVGWAAAGQHPERVLSLAALSIPHPGAIRTANADRGAPGYVRFFQIRGLPETLFTAGGLFLLRRLYASMPEHQRREYLSVFSEPGALRAALAWYRARSDFLAGGELVGEVAQPVLYVFGSRDMPVFVRPQVRELQPRFVRGALEELELEAGHWLMQEAPEQVVNAVMGHLRAQGT